MDASSSQHEQKAGLVERRPHLYGVCPVREISWKTFGRQSSQVRILSPCLCCARRRRWFGFNFATSPLLRAQGFRALRKRFANFRRIRERVRGRPT
jgi:hypothetical protein